MCDYSLESVQSRPAKVGDRLITRLFRTQTRGFSAPENKYVAVCLLPGTELSFANEVKRIRLWPWNTGTIKHKTAIFRKINQGIPRAHHDALEFPDGQIVLLTLLRRDSKPLCFSCQRNLSGLMRRSLTRRRFSEGSLLSA